MRAYLGNRSYYKHIFAIMLPILLQNVITNFVSLLDNIMVGQVGTEPMSGAAIANQLIFVYNLCIFGGMSGIGIFTAQFVGKHDEEGVKQSIRMKIYVALISAVIFLLIFLNFGGSLINLFLHEGNEGLDVAATYGYSMQYLQIMLLEMIPFAVMQVFSSTLREAGETLVPMRTSMIAVGVNLVGNYILIFGKFGAPVLGVEGAAIATVISRFVECIILIVYAKRHTQKFPFFHRIFDSLKIEWDIAKSMMRKGTPLLINELMWAGGMTVLNQCYSLRGLEVVSAINISSTISNLFYCLSMAVGSTIAIVIGQHLGAGKLEEAVEDFKKIMMMAVVLCVGVGAIMVVLAAPLANIYNTTSTVKEMASAFLRVVGIFMPVSAYVNACYFTIRSGGKTVITFLFDSVFTWVCLIPMAFFLSRGTDLPILTIYIIISAMEIIKGIIGFFMVRSRRWVVNLVANE